MTIYTFLPGSTNLANWSDPRIWGGVIPNAADADVILPPVTFGSGQTFYDVDINLGQTYAIRSLTDTGAGMAIGGTLTVSGTAVVQTSFYLYGPKFSAGSLQIGQTATVYGTGPLTAGSAVNAGTLSLTGITASFGAFQNSGTVLVGSGPTSTLAVTGATGPVSGNTLTGGTYEATQGGTLQIKAGGLITNDAAAIVLGAPMTASRMVSQILSFDPGSGTYRPLEATLTAIAVGGLLALNADTYANSVALAVAGTLTLAQGATFSGAGLTVTGSGKVSGLGAITAPVLNYGVLGVSASSADLAVAPGAVARSLVVHGPVTGSGTLQVGVGGAYGGSATTPLTLELDGAVYEGVTFLGSTGILQLDQAASFKGSIAGFSGQDAVVVTNAQYGAVTGYSYAGNSSDGVLTVNLGASSFALAFTGSYTSSNFALSAGLQPGSLAIGALGGSSGGGSTGGGSSGGGSSGGGSSGGGPTGGGSTGGGSAGGGPTAGGSAGNGSSGNGSTGGASAAGGTAGGASAGGGSTITVGGALTHFGSGPLVGFVDGATGEAVSGGLETVAAGGPGYLQWQFINSGVDDLAISTQAANVFLHSGSGNDALQVTNGTNVLDGGLGSNFMTGGSGTDTFFTDARAPGAVWNTLRNFHAGDAATLWGFTAGVSSYTFDPNPAGAVGSQGATLRANIVGGAGRTGTGIDASITFTGLGLAQAQNLQFVTGSNAAGDYLYIYNPGV